MTKKLFILFKVTIFSLFSTLLIVQVCNADIITLNGKFYVITGHLRDIDNDNDGFTENQGDCKDSDQSIYPGATEICSDGIDQDCNGNDTDCAALSLTTVENNLLSLINQERNSIGRPTLVRTSGLDRVISWHVYTMSKDKFLSHTDKNGRNGESRVRYYSGDPSIRCVELIQWWGGTPSGGVHYTGYFNSPDHHSAYLEQGIYNLGPTTHVGVAVFEGNGPIGSQYEFRNGSYSGVLVCDKSPALAIDPYSEN